MDAGTSAGLARGTSDRLRADGRLTDHAIFNGGQFNLNIMLNLGGNSALQVVCGFRPADLNMREDIYDEANIARRTSASSQFTLQRGLRVMG